MDPADVSGAGLGDSVKGYRLVHCLHEGGGWGGPITWVYEAVDDSGRRVAIKILGQEYGKNPDLRDRFLRNLRFMQQIDHAGMVRVLDVAQHPAGMICAILELLSGEHLRQRIHRVHSLPLAAAVDIARQISDCLGHLHAAGAVFRDLVPSDILLVPDPKGGARERAKLVGSSAVLLPGEVQSAILFAPACMSPEQCRGDQKIDGRSDVYVLGLILYEMLSGRHPFAHQASSGEEIMACHIRAEVPPLVYSAPSVPAPLVSLVHRMLAKVPSERPTMHQVVAALDALPDSLRESKR